MKPQEHALDGAYLGHGTVSDRTFALARRVVERAGVETMLQEFREADSPTRLGGRPLAVQPHVAVTLMLILVLEDARAWHVSKAADLVLHRLSQEQHEALGLQPPTPFERRSSEAHKRWRDRIHASLDSIFRLIDPFWNPNRRKAWLKEEWARRVEQRVPEEVELKMDRLYCFNNALLRATTLELPEKYRSRFKGDRAVDGTSYRTTARGTGRDSQVMSIEPNAWWYRRDGDHKVDSLHTEKSVFHGYEATLFCWTKPSTSAPDDYPFLVDAMGHNPPGRDPSSVTVRAARTLFESGAPVGALRADKLYWAGQNIDAFHKPMWAMGFEAVTDYRVNDLGLQGQPVKGAIRVDGDLYCPSMTEAPGLISATSEYSQNKIDAAQLRERIAARESYLLKNKQRSAPGEKRIMTCPASRGDLNCSLWPDLGERHPLALPIFPTASKGSVCDNRNSTSFDEPSKWDQKHRYMTREWFESMGQRSQVEGFNKDLKETPIGSRNGIRVRGYAATFFAVALCTAAVNVRRINAFVRNKAAEEANRSTRRKARVRSAAAVSEEHRRTAGLTSVPDDHQGREQSFDALDARPPNSPT